VGNPAHCPTPETERKPEIECEVAVLGGGLAGLAVAMSLARRGLSVVCIEPEAELRVRVGESLDWSSPLLLRELGFDAERLIGGRIGTAKRHIRVFPSDGPGFELAPDPWLDRFPLRLGMSTLHLDRARFDRELLEAARRAGVVFRAERVSRVHTDAERVTAIETASAVVRAERYVDASGRGRVLARAFKIEAVEYGVQKVSAWTYVATESQSEGTALYFDGAGEQLSWIWEIPISTEVQSIGLTMPAAELKRRLASADNVERVMRQELERHERFRDLLARDTPLEVHTRSLQCYVQRRTSGPNWLLVGEAAAMIDPLTSNGFTFALRFGAHASELIADTLDRPELPRSRRRVYDSCLQRIAHAFNSHIERALYGPSLRQPLGLRRATWVYVVFGFFANAFYQRLRPRGWASNLVLRCGLGLFGAWMAAWAFVARTRPAVTGRKVVPRGSVLRPATMCTESTVDVPLGIADTRLADADRRAPVASRGERSVDALR
jgi:flavin-dependent dehydrogenase